MAKVQGPGIQSCSFYGQWYRVRRSIWVGHLKFLSTLTTPTHNPDVIVSAQFTLCSLHCQRKYWKLSPHLDGSLINSLDLVYLTSALNLSAYARLWRLSCTSTKLWRVHTVNSPFGCRLLAYYSAAMSFAPQILCDAYTKTAMEVKIMLCNSRSPKISKQQWL